MAEKDISVLMSGLNLIQHSSEICQQQNTYTPASGGYSTGELSLTQGVVDIFKK